MRWYTGLPLDNMIFHPTEPIIGILDWGFPLGDPLADLAPTDGCNSREGHCGPAGLDRTELGLPSDEDYIALLSAHGCSGIDNWPFYMAFCFFPCGHSAGHQEARRSAPHRRKADSRAIMVGPLAALGAACIT